MADVVFEPEVKRSLDWVQSMTGGVFVPVAIECKKTQEARLSFEAVKEHQVNGLLAFAEKGIVRKLIVGQGFGKSRRFTASTPFDFLANGKGNAFVLVNFRFGNKSPRKDLPPRVNRCFAVPIDQYVSSRAEFRKNGKASFPIEWFIDNAIECERILIRNEEGKKVGAWNLHPLIRERN